MPRHAQESPYIAPTNNLVRIASVYISSEDNYCNLVQVDNETRMLTFQLGQIKDMIHEQPDRDGDLFIRIGRGLIINCNYVYYINIQNQKLILSDNSRFTHTISASKGTHREGNKSMRKKEKETCDDEIQIIEGKRK